MKLPRQPERYDVSVEGQRSRLIEQADNENLKRGQDIEVGRGRIILRSSGGKRFSLAVSDTGVLSVQAVE